MNTLPKRMIVRDMTVTDVSSVDVPAQKHATAVLIKSASVPIRKNAAEIAAGQAEPLYKAADYADAIMARAGEIAQQTGVSVSKALLDHSGTDSVIIELAKGERAAEIALMKAKARGQSPFNPDRADLLPPAKSEQHNCLLCGNTFTADIPDRRMCERCTP